MRVGIGNDIHRLAEGRNLIIGGVKIPSDKGEVAHSDGDVLIHAIIDAILGATALGDIGALFPDTDEANRGRSSTEMLKSVLKLVDARIVNIDTIVELEKPKLRDYIDSIRESIAECAGIDKCQISVKAKTAEGIGAIGQGEAIKATAIVLID